MKEKFTDSERFIFCKNKYTNNMQMEDIKDEFNPLTLNPRLADILSRILWEHTQFVREKEKGLFHLNNLKDFINSNRDLDKDIIITLLKYCDKGE